MPYRTTSLVNDSLYHIYNRGVEKRTIFSEERDYERFLRTLFYYQFKGPKPAFSNRLRLKEQDFTKNQKIVEVTCYCLMPNHFHLMVKQLTDSGLSEFISKVINSYTKYYNTRYKRVGPLFQGVFKAVLIEDDLQLIHLSRYIHLNPLVSSLTWELPTYKHSSYPYYIGLASDRLCAGEVVLSLFKDRAEYREFVEGHADYAKELEIMKHLLLEDK